MIPARAHVRVPTVSMYGVPRRLMGQRAVLRKERVRGIVCASKNVEVLKAEIASIQQEAADVESQAREQQEKCTELMEVVMGLEKLALGCLDKGDADRARSIMQEKMEIQGKLDKASARVKDLITLEVKLEEAIESKRSKLAESDPDYTAFGDFRDDAAGVRITRDKDGKPTFERTGNVGEYPGRAAQEASSPSSYDDPWRTTRPYSSSTDNQYSAFRERRAQGGASKQQMPDTSYVPSVDELLREGDRKLDDQFLELERKLLEKALKASSDDSSSTSSSTFSTSSPSLSSTPARGAQRPTAGDQSQQKAVIAEFWTMGQNSLMDGALAGLKSDFEPLYEDAGRALIAVTNARIRGEDASPQKLLSLIALSLRPPAHHTSGIFWGVQTAAGASQLSENVRLAIYGAALQTMIVDLLSGESSILPEASAARSEQARAMLVALASAIGLRSSVASHYSVQMLCHASRTYLLNATSSLRQAYSTESRESMERAEDDLQALNRLMSALPMALPLAMGHSAATEVTTALRKVMTPVDARRIDKLFRVICGEDGSSAALRALLEPIFDELD